MVRLACVSFVFFAWATLAGADEGNVNVDGRPPGQNVLHRLAQKVEPSLAGQAERLPQYIDFFRRELGNDSRLIAFDVTASTLSNGHVKLSGFVEFPETRESLAKFLEILGFLVENELKTLPTASLGELTLGFLKTTHCLSYDTPRGRRGVVTDCLFAEPLYLLREDGDHMLVHSGEGYLGYIPSADIHRVDEAAFARYLDGPSVRMLTDHAPDGAPKIPAGARLKWLRNVGDSVAAELPTGETVTLPAACCEVREPPTATIDALIARAERLIGTRYLWGGRSSAGIDCSGLVQIAYATAGWHLPRDANQQFYLGLLTGTRTHTAAMRRGDTMYFIAADGKIRHTALYLGDDRYLNAEVPLVQIGSLNPAHEDYNPRRHQSFAFAKRLVE